MKIVLFWATLLVKVQQECIHFLKPLRPPFPASPGQGFGWGQAEQHCKLDVDMAKCLYSAEYSCHVIFVCFMSSLPFGLETISLAFAFPFLTYLSICFHCFSLWVGIDGFGILLLTWELSTNAVHFYWHVFICYGLASSSCFVLSPIFAKGLTKSGLAFLSS